MSSFSSIALVALVCLTIPVLVVGSSACTGGTGFNLLETANNCVILSAPQADITSSTFVDIPVPRFDSTLGTLKAIHLLNTQVDWAPIATMRVDVDSSGFTVLLNGGSSAIRLESRVDNSVLSINSGGFEDFDDTVGKFRTVTNKVGPVYAVSPGGTGLRGINVQALQWTDTSFQATPLLAISGDVPVVLDVGSVDRFTQRATDINNGDVVVDIDSDGGIPAGYSSAGGGGTWSLRATVTTGFTVTGTPTGGATVTVTITPHMFFNGQVQYDYFVAAAGGDPQFAGFQGQNFQVHGIPDENFALISTPEWFMNGHFVYIASGVCNYNETECFSHPGTYIDQMVFMAEGVHVRIVAGSHSAGLQVFADNKLMRVGQRLSLSSGSDNYVHFKAQNQAVVQIGSFTIGATNSDMFLNLRAACKDSAMITSGAKKVVLTGDSAAENDKIVAQSYPEFPVHGLLGQTVRNIQYPHHKLIEGEPTDYQVSSITSPEFVYSQYQSPK